MGEMAENISQNTLVYPKDRRIWVYVNLKLVAVAMFLGILPVIGAWLWWWFLGLPELNPISQIPDTSEDNPIGFPAWLRVAHFVNLF